MTPSDRRSEHDSGSSSPSDSSEQPSLGIERDRLTLPHPSLDRITRLTMHALEASATAISLRFDSESTLISTAGSLLPASTQRSRAGEPSDTGGPSTPTFLTNGSLEALAEEHARGASAERGAAVQHSVQRSDRASPSEFTAAGIQVHAGTPLVDRSQFPDLGLEMCLVALVPLLAVRPSGDDLSPPTVIGTLSVFRPREIVDRDASPSESVAEASRPRTGLREKERAMLSDCAQLAANELTTLLWRVAPGALLESITDGFFAVDEDWRFTYVNRHAESMLQRTRDSLLGKRVWDEFPEAVDLDVYDQYQHALQEQEEVRFSAFFPPLDTWFEVHAFPFAGGLSVYFDDVTERRRQRDKLRVFSEAIEQIDDAIVITRAEPLDEPGPEIIYVNQAFVDLTGYAREEAIGQTPRIVQGDASVIAQADRAALQRVILNLISNAVKFTGSGGKVTVRTRRRGEEVEILVEDTGIGIDAEFVPHLFDAFTQESSGNAREFEGSGLGLTITYQLVQLMCGSIDVESEKGRGTRFQVLLPKA